MKKNLRILVLGMMFIFSIFFYFLSAQPIQKNNNKVLTFNTKQEEKLALNYLNSLRQGAGLIPFKLQNNLQLATKNHAKYLIQNRTYGHCEETNKSCFTGKFAGERIIKAGYSTALIIENVSSNNRNYKESIDGLFSAIYHRFAFLDFQGDEIGISIQQNIKHKMETAFVYNIGSTQLNQLYKKKTKPSEESLNKALEIHKNTNAPCVSYPFNKQKDVPTVFFNELPDPLPQYDVSGFPISISFNQARYKKVKLLKFQLFDSNHQEVFNTRIHNYLTDPNKRLNKFSFVLFPLNRLKWNSLYYVEFLAILDKKLIKKEWSFKTRNPSLPLHIVENEEKVIEIKVNKENLFYFPPQYPKDLLHNVRYNKNYKMDFLDKNTIKLTALQSSSLTQTLQVGRHKLKLSIQN